MLPPNIEARNKDHLPLKKHDVKREMIIGIIISDLQVSA